MAQALVTKTVISDKDADNPVVAQKQIPHECAQMQFLDEFLDIPVVVQRQAPLVQP